MYVCMYMYIYIYTSQMTTVRLPEQGWSGVPETQTPLPVGPSKGAQPQPASLTQACSYVCAEQTEQQRSSLATAVVRSGFHEKS